MTSEKKPFWLSKERQIEIYGEKLPPNYYAESRHPHYIYYKQMIEGELIKFSTGKIVLSEALRVAPGMLKERLKKEKVTTFRHLFGDHWPSFYRTKEKESEDGEIKKSTLKVIDRTKDKFMSFWKNKFLDKLDTPFDVQNKLCWENVFMEFEEHFREKNGNETMFNVLKYLNAYTTWMHKNGLIRRKVDFKDPRAKKERKKRKVEQNRTLTPEQVLELLKHAELIQQVAILLGFFLAFRISDVANLSWDRINLDPDDPYIEFLGDDKEETTQCTFE